MGSVQSRQQCVKSRDNESLVTTGAPRADGINQKSAAELGPLLLASGKLSLTLDWSNLRPLEDIQYCLRGTPTHIS